MRIAVPCPIHRAPVTQRLFPAVLTAMLLALATPVTAQIEWPQEIVQPEGSIIIYQPQPEKLTGNILSGRAAISLEQTDQEPIFGVMWFTARLSTDRDTDTVLVHDFRVESVAWPDSKDAGEQRFTTIVEGAVADASVELSMERLSASLETAELVQESLEQIKNDPPKIVFAEELSVLLVFDGEPRFNDIEDSGYERAMNTPFAVACKKRWGGNCWLSSGTFWYQAEDALGPWRHDPSPPTELVAMVPRGDADAVAPSSPPAIVVATEPTELIVTDGKPDWVSLAGGELLYVSNTESPWLRELATGNMYLLLSGRWFRSKTQQGPWTFVRADELPDSFSAIPPASDIGGLRTSVAGTEEAEDAMRDAAIPQTAAIRRDEASLAVEYDGDPKFEKIEGTDVSYAVNTAAQVVEIDGRYYAVDNGVWFTSRAATGPWIVADEVPSEQIAEIPPSAPVYNVTHVNVYESTPEVVYVGYTPGYLWSYPYYGVPIYGTGWYYPPYWGGWYYPRPPTWGFHVGYNPWTGWNFGLSWSNGFFSVGVGWSQYPCCGGWYGGGYRGPVVINTGDINIGNNINIGNRQDIRDRVANNPDLGNRLQNRGDNLYNRPENRARNADRATVQREMRQARPATGRANDVFADRSGQVARRDGNQWQTREAGQWQPAPDSRPVARPETPVTRPATPSTRPSTPSFERPSSRPSTPSYNRGSLNHSDLNRHYGARQHGASREMRRPIPRGGGRRG